MYPPRKMSVAFRDMSRLICTDIESVLYTRRVHMSACMSGGDEFARLQKQLQIAQAALLEEEAEHEKLKKKWHPVQSENKSLQSERDQLDNDVSAEPELLLLYVPCVLSAKFLTQMR